MDPLAEIVASSSPYIYVYNNPARNIDEDGRWADDGHGGTMTSDPQEIANFSAQVNNFLNSKKEAQDKADNDEGSRESGGDGKHPKEKKSVKINWALASLGDGFVGGFKNTLHGIADPFTSWNGYIKNVGNALTLNVYNSTQMLFSGYAILTNGPYNSSDYLYASGFAGEKVLEYLITERVASIGGRASRFEFNNGAGIFGEEGFNIRGYKFNAFYRNANSELATPTGTLFSVKQMEQGGNLLRWDYGLLHPENTTFGYHSTFRFNINGITYGSTKQYPVFAPFQFWKYPQK